MSLIQDVVDTVNEMGEVTVDDIAPQLPQYTHIQISRALNAARFERRITLVERGARQGYRGGSLPSVYAPLGAPSDEDDDAPLRTRTCIRGDYGIPRVSSVWELGAVA